MTGVIFSVTISMEKNAKICHARLGAIGRKHNNMSLSLSVSYELL